LKLKLFLLALLFILSAAASLTQAVEYYADLTIVVNRDGTVKVEGITNDPELSPDTYQEWTSKKGAYWLLNISSDKSFSDYILAVLLPEGAEFNYLKASGRSRVSYANGIKIVSSGTDNLSLVVQYQVGQPEKSLRIFYIGFALFVFFIVLFLSRKLWLNSLAGLEEPSKKEVKKKSKQAGDAENNSTENEKLAIANDKLYILKRTLSETQSGIIDLIIEKGGSITQKQLQNELAVPKATLSRNVDALVKRNIVHKQSRGMTNVIRLNDEFL
jgi:uncharacterized membrane protein